jgi:hypothetical protein
MANSTVSSVNGLGSYWVYSRLPTAFLSLPTQPVNCAGAVGSWVVVEELIFGGVCGRAKVVKCVVPSSTSFSASYKRTGPGHADGEDDIVDRRTKWERGVGSRRVREWGRGEPPALALTLVIVPWGAAGTRSRTGVDEEYGLRHALTYTFARCMTLQYPRIGIVAYESTPSRVELAALYMKAGRRAIPRSLSPRRRLRKPGHALPTQVLRHDRYPA